MCRIDKSTEIESRLVIAREWGGGSQLGVTANGYGVSLRGNDRVLKLIVVIIRQLCGYTEKHLMMHFKKISAATLYTHSHYPC